LIFAFKKPGWCVCSCCCSVGPPKLEARSQSRMSLN